MTLPRMFRPGLAAVIVTALHVGAARAEEGMWTFDNFPSAAVKKQYGFEPTQAWLDKARLASVRLAQGCSASFVSPRGLVMTNHHCAHRCIQQLSTKARDLVKNGFMAASDAEERRCPELEVNQLTAIKDVTERVAGATKGLSGKQFADAQKAEIAKIEKECATSDDTRCNVVTLYQGGLYHLYTYRRFQDVRLVFAPELDIAFFGGDPDNFNFPRFDLDMTFLRVYDEGKPLTPEAFFPFSPAGAKEGELTFISGNPGRTSRELTVAELEVQRDLVLPRRLLWLAERRGMATEYQNRGAEQKRTIGSFLFSVENSFKALRGRQEALLSDELFAAKVKAEQQMRAQVSADPKKKAAYGAAWDNIAAAMRQLEMIYEPLVMLEQARGFEGDLFDYARSLVRAADELVRPNEERLREYTDGKLPELKQDLFSTAPIYEELEIARLTFSLVKLREELGADAPVVKKVLGKESPASLARRTVKGTKLASPAVRKKLFEGGKAAIQASKDPMILLALVVDPEARAVRKIYEEEIESQVTKNHELIAKARFEMLGTSVYPDATFSARLSYGSVKGWEESGRLVPPLTTIGGAFERHTGEAPYALPKSWLAAKDKLSLETPFNFVTTNDIIGGNSGSPVVNKDLQIVGLVFDGNIHSLGGEYGFDPVMNRAVSVHSAAILESLAKIYGAGRLVQELKADKPGS